MNIAIVGTGTMGKVFARHFEAKGAVVSLFGRGDDKRNVADCIFLAVKPKDWKTAAEELGPCDGKVVWSIMAGVSVADLKGAFPGSFVVQSMPNLAVRLGTGVFAFVEDFEIPEDVKEKVMALVEGTGKVLWVEESKMDAVTALAGSGPGFVMAYVEAMIDGGVELGLSKEEAQEITEWVFKGSVALLEEEDAKSVRERISASGGTTIAGLEAFGRAGGRKAIIDCLKAAYLRSYGLRSYGQN